MIGKGKGLLVIIGGLVVLVVALSAIERHYNWEMTKGSIRCWAEADDMNFVGNWQCLRNKGWSEWALNRLGASLELRQEWDRQATARPR